MPLKVAYDPKDGIWPPQKCDLDFKFRTQVFYIIQALMALYNPTKFAEIQQSEWMDSATGICMSLEALKRISCPQSGMLGRYFPLNKITNIPRKYF